MPDITGVDVRRMDQRTNVLENPFWFTSGLITKDHAAKGAVLISFPSGYWGVTAAVVEVIEAFSGGTITLDIGEGTIATDDAPTTVTIVDLDEIVPTADITNGTIGKYPALTGDALALWAAGKLKTIQGAAATVPVIYATLTTTTTITAGKARVHMLLHKIPVA